MVSQLHHCSAASTLGGGGGRASVQLLECMYHSTVVCRGRRWMYPKVHQVPHLTLTGQRRRKGEGGWLGLGPDMGLPTQERLPLCWALGTTAAISIKNKPSNPATLLLTFLYSPSAPRSIVAYSSCYGPRLFPSHPVFTLTHTSYQLLSLGGQTLSRVVFALSPRGLRPALSSSIETGERKEVRGKSEEKKEN
ncbi:hypothetical protein L209DRAFT_41487 [Thermothelomyces heterothallicus CBS 203.75]